MPQQRAKIGKYAAENGPTKAAKCFTTIWGIHVNESTARRLKSEYLGKLKEHYRGKVCSRRGIKI